MGDAQFWTWPEEKRALVFENLKKGKQIVDPMLSLAKKLEDIELLFALACEENDEKILVDLGEDLEKYEVDIEKMKLKATFTHEDDSRNAFLSIQAGAGGTDACDWANMLLRMYLKYCDKKDFEVEFIDQFTEEEGGIKNATIHIKGPWAYGYLKSERGVHRLVRISPFDANARRHTSFAAIDLVPEFEADAPIEINEKDIRIDVYRSSGAGGQHVNVTDSAVRITHYPTGIVVCCQNERSQHKNKAMAMKILTARLYQRRRQDQQDAINKEYGNKSQVSWSNQIRSYVLHPYTLVKDHRTSVEMGNAEAVLEGELDRLIEAYLLMTAAESREKERT